jgi:hypothetical protein
VIRLPRHLGAHPESPAAELVRCVDQLMTLELVERRTGAVLVTETDRERLKRARRRWENR